MIKNYRTDQAYFSFSLPTLAENYFELRKFNCFNDSISEDYCFEIEAIAKQFINPATLLNQIAKLHWHTENEKCYRHGIISYICYSGKELGNHHYKLHLVSPLFPLKIRITHRSFVDKHIDYIIQEVLESAGWLKNSYRCQFSHCAETISYEVQYQQYDYDFLQQLLFKHGINYVWQQTAEHAILIFTDNLNTTIVNAPYLLQPIEIYELTELLPEIVTLNSYNPQQSSLEFTSEAKNQTSIAGNGSINFHGLNYKDTLHEKNFTTLWQQKLDSHRLILTATTDVCMLEAGKMVSINNSSYRIFKLEHCMEQNVEQLLHQQAGLTYKATLWLIPEKLNFYPLTTATDKSTTNSEFIQPFAPAMQAISTGTIEGINNSYPYLSEAGDYYVHFIFDHAKPSAEQASIPIRLVQPYGGAQKDAIKSGFHFPLHQHTEVAITWLYGNIRYPILLGTLNHPCSPSTVNSSNRSQNILRTKRGHTLCMDDQEAKECISLHSPGKTNELILDAAKNKQHITLQTQGELNITAGKDLHIVCNQSNLHECTHEEYINVTKEQKTFTKQNAILNAGDSIELEAKNTLTLKTISEQILFKTAQSIYLHATNIKWKSSSCEIAITIAPGSYHLLGNKIAIEAKQSIQLQQGMNSINMQKGNLIISGISIFINAEMINCPKPNGG